MKSVASSLTATPSRPRIDSTDLPLLSPSSLGHARPTACSTYPSVSPLHSNDLRWYRNIDPTYPEWTNLPQETLDFRWAGFSPALRYSCQHSLLYAVHQTLQFSFCPHTMLLYQHLSMFLSFGSKFQPRLSSAQSHSTSELLRTL